MKVVIVAGPAHPNFMRPEYSEGWEFWGLNAIRPQWFDEKGYRWSRWFNLHRWEHLVRDWKQGLEAEVEWAKKNPEIPFYTVGDWKPGGLPNEIAFPREELNAVYPRPDYHAGSFDWMVPFAHSLGATEIALHGVCLHHATGEPESARACLEYWIGIVEALGCPVFVADDCDLFWQYHIVRSRSVYGWDDVHMLEEKPTFEHLMRQALKRGWPVPEVDVERDTEAWRQQWINYWLQMRQVTDVDETMPQPPVRA